MLETQFTAAPDAGSGVPVHGSRRCLRTPEARDPLEQFVPDAERGRNTNTPLDLSVGGDTAPVAVATRAHSGPVRGLRHLHRERDARRERLEDEWSEQCWKRSSLRRPTRAVMSQFMGPGTSRERARAAIGWNTSSPTRSADGTRLPRSTFRSAGTPLPSLLRLGLIRDR